MSDDNGKTDGLLDSFGTRAEDKEGLIDAPRAPGRALRCGGPSRSRRVPHRLVAAQGAVAGRRARHRRNRRARLPEDERSHPWTPGLHMEVRARGALVSRDREVHRTVGHGGYANQVYGNRHVKSGFEHSVVLQGSHRRRPGHGGPRLRHPSGRALRARQARRGRGRLPRVEGPHHADVGHADAALSRRLHQGRADGGGDLRRSARAHHRGAVGEPLLAVLRRRLRRGGAGCALAYPDRAPALPRGGRRGLVERVLRAHGGLRDRAPRLRPTDRTPEQCRKEARAAGEGVRRRADVLPARRHRRGGGRPRRGTRLRTLQAHPQQGQGQAAAPATETVPRLRTPVHSAALETFGSKIYL